MRPRPTEAARATRSWRSRAPPPPPRTPRRTPQPARPRGRARIRRCEDGQDGHEPESRRPQPSTACAQPEVTNAAADHDGPAREEPPTRPPAHAAAARADGGARARTGRNAGGTTPPPFDVREPAPMFSSGSMSDVQPSPRRGPRRPRPEPSPLPEPEPAAPASGSQAAPLRLVVEARIASRLWSMICLAENRFSTRRSRSGYSGALMKSAWVDREPQAAVDRYAAAGIAPISRCASTPRV